MSTGTGKRKHGANVGEELPSTSTNEQESGRTDANLVQRRSGRLKNRLSWRKSGGTIEKVVIKEEPVEEILEEEMNEEEEEEQEEVMVIPKRQRKKGSGKGVELKEQHGEDARVIEAFIEKYQKKLKEVSSEEVDENGGEKSEVASVVLEEEDICDDALRGLTKEDLEVQPKKDGEEFLVVIVEPGGEGKEAGEVEEADLAKELAVGEDLDLVTVTGTQPHEVEVKTNGRAKRQKQKKGMCNLCYKFVVTDNLERHIAYQCKENPMRKTLLKCHLCLFMTDCKSKMDEHLTIHPLDFVPKKGKNCVCEVCGIELTSARSKVHHEWKQHDYFGKRISYQCSICCKRFPSKWQHYEHMGYHLNRREFVCDSCGKKFRSKQEVKDHRKLAHIEEQFPLQCGHCRIGIETEPLMKAHECKMVAELIQDKGFRGVNCVVYLEIIDDDMAMNEGEGNVLIVDKVNDKPVEDEEEDEGPDDGGRKLECEAIKVSVKQEENQSRQPRIFFDLTSIAEYHSGPIKVAERYMCEYCGDLFTTKSMKFNHRRAEHGYRKLPLELRQAKPECEICGKKFVYRDSLKKHYVHTHSDERNYKCPTCGKTFKRPTDREYHVNTMHKNIYKYFCNICGHGVHRKQYLKNHQCTRTHRRKHSVAQFTVPPKPQEAPPPLRSGLDFLHQAGAHLEAAQAKEGAGHVMDAESLACILAKTDGDESKSWVIQPSIDGQQILVIEDNLVDVVQDQMEILVDAEVVEIEEA